MHSILAQTAAPKCPQSRVITDFARKPKSPIFGDFSGGNQKKIAEKVGRTKGLEKHLSANGVICSLVCTQSANIGQHSGANGGSKSARKTQLLEILKGHLNRPLSKILLREDLGKMAEKVGQTKKL